MSPRQAMACVITAGAMWGTISIFVRHLDSMGLSAMQICFVRTLVALVVLFWHSLCSVKSYCAFPLRIARFYLYRHYQLRSLWNVLFLSVSTGEVAVAAVLLYTSPIFVMIFSILLFHESLTKWKIGALFSTCTGCVLVSGVLSGSLTLPLFAIATGLAAGFFYSTYSIFSHYALQNIILSR